MTALLLSHELYAELGIRLLYHSDGRLVVESRPVVYSERVGGGTSPDMPWALAHTCPRFPCSSTASSATARCVAALTDDLLLSIDRDGSLLIAKRSGVVETVAAPDYSAAVGVVPPCRRVRE